MSSSEAFPSNDFLGAFDSATWKAMQQYIVSAQQLPTSPNAQVEAILSKLQAAANAANSGPVADVQLAANGLYNYGSTIGATLSAIPNLLSSGSGAKTGLQQLLNNLVTSIDGPTLSTTKTATGVSSFSASTIGAGQNLAKAADTVRERVKQSNTTVGTGSHSLAVLIAAQPLDADQIESTIQSIETAAKNMLGQSFVGLSFDTQKGTKAAATAKDQVAAALQAWTGLQASIKALEVKVSQTPEDKLASLPELSELSLKRQITAWSKLTSDVHSFMMNFSVVAQ